MHRIAPADADKGTLFDVGFSPHKLFEPKSRVADGVREFVFYLHLIFTGQGAAITVTILLTIFGSIGDARAGSGIIFALDPAIIKIIVVAIAGAFDLPHKIAGKLQTIPLYQPVAGIN